MNLKLIFSIVCIYFGACNAQFNRNNFLIGRNSNSAACNAFEIQLGEANIIKVASNPKGYCSYCCHVNTTEDIKFYLYTKEGPPEGIQLSHRKVNRFATSELNPYNPTVFFIHGFVEISPDSENAKGFRQAYLERPEGYNVIIVDWSNLSVGPWYMEASQNIAIVGKTIAKFLRRYNKAGLININYVHLVGFSLGAHICGFTGKYLSDMRIPRITGLDAASPGFSTKKKEFRLNKDDADFVDVIHTNSRWLGFPVSIGHVDFYVNDNSKYQPGCSLSNLSDRNQIDDFFSCSHMRAVQYYIESVQNPAAFPATRCKMFGKERNKCNFETDAYMGFGTNSDWQGDFYLLTKETSPFGMNALEQNEHIEEI